MEEGVRHAHTETPVRSGIPPPVGRVGPGRRGLRGVKLVISDSRRHQCGCIEGSEGHMAALPRALHAQLSSARRKDAAAYGLGCHRHGVRAGLGRCGAGTVALGGQLVAQQVPQARHADGRGRERRARVHDLPTCALDPVLRHEPVGASEREDQAPNKPRGHLSKRRVHRPRGRRLNAQAERRMVAQPPLHEAAT